MTRTPQDFIASHTLELEPLARNLALAYWDASISGKREDFDRVAGLEKEMVALYGRADEYEEVCRFAANLGAIEEPMVARQIDILRRAYRECQGDREVLEQIVEIESELTREFNTFRATFRGTRRTNNALENVLKNTQSSDEAREAWEALKQVGAIAAPRIRELARLRNRHARALGSENFYAFSLDLKELSQTKLFAMLEALARQSAPLFRELKDGLDARLAREFGIAREALRPWHYRNPFFQEMPEDAETDLDGIFEKLDLEELTRRYYDGIGLDIREILERSDLYEKEGKDQHAFCIDVDTPRDVRVLCNIKPTGRWMSTMLHEFGHAVYDRYIDADLPLLLREPAHTLSTEAIAMLNERFLHTADFLAGVVGIERKRAEEIERRARRHQSHRLLVFTRWVLVMAHFERALYEDPERDLCVHWWRTVERFQWLEGSERLGEPDWASKIHLAGAPVYYQNYLLGEMNASQILASMRREVDGAGIVGNPLVGAFLRERIFRPGATEPWNRRLAAATGREMQTDFFLEDLRPAP